MRQVSPMQESTSPALLDQPPSLALVLPTGRAEAERRIAGVSAVARVLIAAFRAGIGRAWVVLDAPGGLAAAADDDLRRAGCAMQVEWLVRDDAKAQIRNSGEAVLALSCALLPAPAALQRVMRATAPTALGREGRPAALSLSARAAGPDLIEGLEAAAAGAAWIEADPGEIIALSPAWAATRRIVRGTGKPSDGVVSRWINRPISQSISTVLLAAPGVRPSQITALTAVIGIAMFGFLVLGGALGLCIGGVLFQLASVIDGVDGEIARAAFRSSAAGAVADSAVDMITNLAFVLGVTIGLYRVEGPIYGVIGVADVAAFSLGLAILAVLARRRGGEFDLIKNHYDARIRSGVPRRIFETLRDMTSRDFFALLFAVLAATGWSRAIPWVFAVGAVVWLVLIGCALPAFISPVQTGPARPRAPAAPGARDG